MAESPKAEKAPRFAVIAAGECNSGHATWTIRWHTTGEVDRLHQGSWPQNLTDSERRLLRRTGPSPDPTVAENPVFEKHHRAALAHLNSAESAPVKSADAQASMATAHALLALVSLLRPDEQGAR